MTQTDWTRIAEIYTHAIEMGRSTVVTECPSYAEWDAAHCPDCRFVLEADGIVAGWCALSPTSTRPAYRGVVEVSIYLSDEYQHAGFGTLLLEKLCEESEKAGYWTLFSNIFSTNEASIALHKKCGFREIGYREKIGKDRFGNWQNTVMFERRNKIQ